MGAAERTDAQLVQACIDGDVDAFSQLVERYQQLVCAVSYAACGDVALSEDIAQEVFVIAWSDAARIREPAKLKSWLCSVARNLARDVRRKRRREVTQTDSDLDRERDVRPSPHEAVESVQRSDVLWGALEDIPESYREPLVLFYREGQSLKQVAALLGLTIATVKQRLSRGRKALRGTLAPIATALVDTAPGKAFTATVIAAALARTSIAAAATRPTTDTITAGEAVSRPAAAAAGGGAIKLAAGAAIAAIAIAVLWVLSRPADRPPVAEPTEAIAASPTKPLPTLYGAGVEPAGEVTGTRAIEGVVVDVFDNPVAGAVVTVSGKPPRTATSDADGRFEIGGLADRVYGVDAHTGSGSASPLAVRAGAGEPLVLRIEPGSTLEITAVDGDTGEVMEGVEVEVRSEIRGTKGRTDDHGRALFHGITAHESEVFLRTPGYAAMVVLVNLSGEPGVNRRRLVLRRGVPVSGRVLDPAGRPVEGAEIMLDGGIKLMAYDPRGIKTDADGRWTVPAVAPGRYQVHVEHPAWQSGRVDLEVGDRPVDSLIARLGAGVAIRGRAVLADGSPAASAVVFAFGPDFQKRVTAAATGEFVIEGLPAARVSIAAERYPETADVIEVDLAGGSAAPITVRLADACIRGQVVDAAGRPVRSGRVRAHSWKVDVFSLYESHDRTDSRGRFALCRLQRGHEYGITAIAEGVPLFFLYDEASLAKAEAGGAEPLTIRLEEPGTIAGEIAGDVPAEFGVSLSRDQLSHLDVTIPFAETDGELALTEIPPGTYTVLVSAEGRSTAIHRNVEVRPGGVVELPPSTLSRPGRLEGVVVDHRGAPVAGARVHAGRGLGGNARELIDEPEGGDVGGDPNGPGGNLFSATTGADGRFVLEVSERANTFVLLAAEHPRLGRSAPQIVKLGGGPHRLALSATGSLSGRVRGDRQAMVAAFAVGDDGRTLDHVLTTDVQPDGSYRFEQIGAGPWRIVASGGDSFPSAAAPGAVSIEVPAGASVRRDLDLSGPLPAWTPAALDDLDTIARSACDCADDACRLDVEQRFRSALQSRSPPGPEPMQRTEAAIVVIEDCLGLRR